MQYEMIELSWQAKEPEGSFAQVALEVTFWQGDVEKTVNGFYAGDGIYKARFYPEQAGVWNYRCSGLLQDSGSFEVAPGKPKTGMIRSVETHFTYDSGEYFYPFGTTVYALIHQEDALVNETMNSLAEAPFNKIRFCVFPKHYDFNHNEPTVYPFEKDEAGKWDVHRPCFVYWERLEKVLFRLGEMGIQADLILFHPYDRWGFANLPQKDNLVYLDYLLRRLAAIPNLWWSLSNEYDLVFSKSLQEWEEIEAFVADNDPFHHLLSNHNCFIYWDFARPAVTHVSAQTKQLTSISHLRKKYRKPIMIDECCYEGNIQHAWGSISGKEMTNRFWRVVTTGGYCTHGETFLDPEKEILWWSRGGKLKGQSPERIAFLRSVIEELPGPLDPQDGLFTKIVEEIDEKPLTQIIKELGFESDFLNFAQAFVNMGQDARAFSATEFVYQGYVKDEAYLIFYDLRTCSVDTLNLPEENEYRVELIDTWEMTRKEIASKASGKTKIELPAKEGMAVLATKIK